MSLSDKIYDENYCSSSETLWVKAKDVKDFIAQETDLIQELMEKIDYDTDASDIIEFLNDFRVKRDSLAGRNLI